MQNLSVVIITYNEQRNIRACLESARWADEIVIVDAYSTDNTVAIAREFTDKIYQRPWEGFGIQKNFAMQKATCPWIFILDSDERISEELRNEILELIQGSPSSIVGYRVPRKNYYYGRWIKTGGAYPDYQLRLLRNGQGYLDDAEPHNKMVLKGAMGTLQTPLDHLTSPTVSDHLRKMPNFSRLAAQEKYKSKKHVGWYDLFFPHVATFLKMYLSKGAWREGIAGFIYSGFASLYTFLKYARLWEMLYVKRREQETNYSE
jgi:glycosyltransferase involved in cell wall biosynthesis